jgi:hypothetical protein
MPVKNKMLFTRDERSRFNKEANLLSRKENTLTRSARDLSCDQAAALAAKDLSLSLHHQHRRASRLSTLFSLWQ